MVLQTNAILIGLIPIIIVGIGLFYFKNHILIGFIRPIDSQVEMKKAHFTSCFIFTLAFLVGLPLFSCGEAPHQDAPLEKGSSLGQDDVPLPQADIVVLGQLAFCHFCQWIEPHIRYTEVLAGEVKVDSQGNSQEKWISIMKADEHIFKPGTLPIYTSRKDEICFVNKVFLEGFGENNYYYEVVAIWEATSENLGRFKRIRGDP